MAVIFLLIGISLLVAIAFLAGFIWAQNSGQYEDDYSPSVRILYDDENQAPKNKPERSDDTSK